MPRTVIRTSLAAYVLVLLLCAFSVAFRAGDELARGAGAGVAALAPHGLVDSPLDLPATAMLFWLLLGCPPAGTCWHAMSSLPARLVVERSLGLRQRRAKLRDQLVDRSRIASTRSQFQRLAQPRRTSCSDRSTTTPEQASATLEAQPVAVSRCLRNRAEGSHPSACKHRCSFGYQRVATRLPDLVECGVVERRDGGMRHCGSPKRQTSDVSKRGRAHLLRQSTARARET